jgi:hypothetical protein
MAPNNVKHKSKAKFEPYLYLFYVKEFMPQLKKFIQKHPNDQIIFWPHLALSCYAKKTRK